MSKKDMRGTLLPPPTNRKGDDMIGNVVSGKKWWLLKNGKILYYGGILSLLVYSLILFPTLLVLLYGKTNFPSVILIVLFSLVFVFVIIVIFSSKYPNLYKVVEKLPPRLVVEDFDPIRAKVTVKDEKSRRYHIKFYHFLGEPELEHCQVWTPLKKSLRYPESSLYDRKAAIFYFRSFPSVFDETVRRLIPRNTGKIKNTSCVQFVGVAKERGEPVLVAIVSKKADSAEMNRVLNLLRTIVYEIEY